MDSTVRSRSVLGAVGAMAAVALLVVACGSVSSEFDGENPPPPDYTNDGSPFNNAQPDGGDPFANDPPPKWCGPTSQPEPPKPGGTVDCPDDKNKPGCGCTNLGEEAACWTGLRANRKLGVCKDGVTKCVQVSENVKAWGPCVGQVLPTPGATKGKEACRCFSLGQWKLANLSPCFREYCGIDPGAGNPCPPANVTGYYAVSTHDDGTGGGAKCTPQGPNPPPALPPGPWTTDTLNVDCAGHFKLCYELKAGNFDAPSPTDCSLTKQCVEADYLTENVEQAFPPLDPWVSLDQDCAKKWNVTGGYGEMTVIGESVRCDKVDDGAGSPFVFNRVKYCPPKCRDMANAGLPECQNCQQGGSGQF